MKGRVLLSSSKDSVMDLTLGVQRERRREMNGWNGKGCTKACALNEPGESFSFE